MERVRVRVPMDRKAERAPTVVVQRRMTVGRSDDSTELEADRVADRVVSALAAQTLPSTTAGGRTRRSAAPSDGAAAPTARRVQRVASVGSGHGDAIDAGTESRIQRARGGGRALDPAVREPMESAFGGDLGDVRVHTDQVADALNRQLDARAFTTGTDVFFGKGEFAPGTSAGRHLLAHELAHTFQQTGAQPIRRAFSLDKTKWAEAKSMTATSGSATGVFFLKDKSGKTIVVKGAHGTARLEMAGEIMEAAEGEAVPQRMISLKSKEGKQLVSVMKSLAKKAPIDQTTGNNEVLAKFNRQIAGGGFDAVQVMESYENLGNLQDLAASGDMAATVPMMVKNGFFRQLGRMHAADVFMGNEDRLSRGSGGGMGVALKNIFFNVKTGQAVGLDMELNAHSLEQITGDIREEDANTDDGLEDLGGSNAPSLQGSESLDFANFCVFGSLAKKKYTAANGKERTGGMGMRGGEQFVPGQDEAADPAKAGALFDQMKKDLLEEATRQNNASALALAQFDWGPAKQQFTAGVAQGLANIAAKSGDLAASADRKLGKKGGAQPMFDPNVFRVRAMYLKLKKIGYTDNTEILDSLAIYVDMLRQGRPDAEFIRMSQRIYLQAHGTGAKTRPVVMPNLPVRPGRRVPAKTH